MLLAREGLSGIESHIITIFYFNFSLIFYHSYFFQYLEMRFHSAIRSIASFMFILDEVSGGYVTKLLCYI